MNGNGSKLQSFSINTCKTVDSIQKTASMNTFAHSDLKSEWIITKHVRLTMICNPAGEIYQSPDCKSELAVVTNPELAKQKKPPSPMVMRVFHN